MKDENDTKTCEMPLIDPATAPKKRGRPRKTVDASTLEGEEVGGEKRGKGRPRQHSSAAEKQKAYRERLKAEGKRVVTRVVLDVRDESKPLQSDLIDLSAVRKW